MKSNRVKCFLLLFCKVDSWEVWWQSILLKPQIMNFSQELAKMKEKYLQKWWFKHGNFSPARQGTKVRKQTQFVYANWRLPEEAGSSFNSPIIDAVSLMWNLVITYSMKGQTVIHYFKSIFYGVISYVKKKYHCFLLELFAKMCPEAFMEIVSYTKAKGKATARDRTLRCIFGSRVNSNFSLC